MPYLPLDFRPTTTTHRTAERPALSLAILDGAADGLAEAPLPAIVVIEDLSELTLESALLLIEIVDACNGSTLRGPGTGTSAVSELSKSELRVLRYLPTNLSRPDIARELYVSVNTVNTHVRNIYSKLDASNRTQAVDRARQLRLLAR